MNAAQRYQEALASCPVPGNGFHSASLGVANIGALAGLTPGDVLHDLRRIADQGKRHVTDRELRQTVEKAFAEYNPDSPPPPRNTKPAIDAEQVIKSILARGSGVDEVELWGCSPIPLIDGPEQDAKLLLSTLYRPTDHLWIGGQFDCGKRHVRPASDWVRRNLSAWPHIIVNPLSGAVGTKHDGGPSYRSDACVADHKYAVLEFDGQPREWQLAFWSGCRMPVAALIDSGGKSIHGWVRVDAENAEAWQRDVKPLFQQYLKPLGVDAACSNPARLSRLPGHRRKDSRRWQRLLFLDPSARGPLHYLRGSK